MKRKRAILIRSVGFTVAILIGVTIFALSFSRIWRHAHPANISTDAREPSDNNASFVKVSGIVADGYMMMCPYRIRSDKLEYDPDPFARESHPYQTLFGLDVAFLPDEILGTTHYIHGRKVMNNGKPLLLSDGTEVLTDVSIDGIRYQSNDEWNKAHPEPSEEEDPFSIKHSGKADPFRQPNEED